MTTTTTTDGHSCRGLPLGDGLKKQYARDKRKTAWYTVVHYSVVKNSFTKYSSVKFNEDECYAIQDFTILQHSKGPGRIPATHSFQLLVSYSTLPKNISEVVVKSLY